MINNQTGGIIAKTDASIKADKDINNSQGKLNAQNLTVSSGGTLTNQGTGSRHPYFVKYGDDPTPPPASLEKDYLGNIKDAYWVNAGDLEAGHKVIDDDGNWQTVTSVRVEQKPLNSYNLEVNIDHTFFIRGIGGLDGIWVHNNNCFLDKPDNLVPTKIAGIDVYEFMFNGKPVKVIQKRAMEQTIKQLWTIPEHHHSHYSRSRV